MPRENQETDGQASEVGTLHGQEFHSSARLADRGTQAFRVVLTKSLKDREWVTHVKTHDGGKNWGHYFDDYSEAVIDYLERCRKYGLMP